MGADVPDDDRTEDALSKLVSSYTCKMIISTKSPQLCRNAFLTGMRWIDHLIYDCADDLWKKVLRGGTVQSEALLKGVFIETLHGSICQSTRNICGHKDIADIEELDRHAKSMAILLGEPSNSQDNSHRPPKNRRGGNELGVMRSE